MGSFACYNTVCWALMAHLLCFPRNHINVKVPCLLFIYIPGAYAISKYLINKALDGASYLPVILLLALFML